MGKSLEFVRLEVRLPKELHAEFKQVCEDELPLNAALCALVQMLVAGEVQITRRPRVLPFVAKVTEKVATIRDVMSGDLKAKAA